jgi:RHS repeat-associated protein
MDMPGRQYNSTNGYRYGFNGKEMDNEAKGEGNQYDYGMRIYDPRLSRFLSVDPLTKSFAWYSPYQFAGNTPIAAIDLDGEEQKIVIHWHDANGSVTRTKIVKADFNTVNQLYQSLSKGLNTETTYTLEGTKFNSTNAHFVVGFDAYKKGTGNPRNPNAPSIRPNAGILRFNITTNAKGGQTVSIVYDNVPINEKELLTDASRGFGKVLNVVGTGIEGGGYVASLTPGGQAVGVPMIGIGKTVDAVGDGVNIIADLVEGKKEDAAIKTGFLLGGAMIGFGANKLPIKSELSKQALDTYGSRGVGAIKDGYFDNRSQKVEESDKLDLKIEQKK